MKTNKYKSPKNKLVNKKLLKGNVAPSNGIVAYFFILTLGI